MTMAALLRRWLQPLRKTPLHPQWFAFRDEEKVRRWVHAMARGRVLDIGCAGGWAKTVLSPGCKCTGLDYPDSANSLYCTRPDVFADGAQCPFVDDTFDTVLSLEVLGHVSQPAAVLAEIERILKPGGTLLLTMPFLYPLHDAPHDYQRYTESGLQLALAQSGLEVVELRPRNKGFQVAGLLLCISCADAVIGALRTRRWRLLFAPLLICAIPLVNVAAWLFGPLTGSAILAGGHRAHAQKS